MSEEKVKAKVRPGCEHTVSIVTEGTDQNGNKTFGQETKTYTQGEKVEVRKDELEKHFDKLRPLYDKDEDLVVDDQQESEEEESGGSSNYGEMLKDELVEIAQDRDISRPYEMNKDELIEVLEETE